jgi:hypothetical protein
VYRRDGAVIARAVDTQLNAFAVDSFSLPQYVEMPFVVTWEGALRITTPGTYEFEAQGSGPYAMALDGQLLLQAAEEVPEQPRLTHASRSLEVGLHPLVARWDSTRRAQYNRRIFQVFWTPPGSERVLIPPSAFLRPAAAEASAGATVVSLVSRRCVGDCNGDGRVTVDDIVAALNVALGNTPLSSCPGGGTDRERHITVVAILAAANNALNGCP